MSIEGGSSRSHYVEESFWKRFWTCRLTDYWCWWWWVFWNVTPYGLFFHPEDGGNMYLKNVPTLLPDSPSSHPTRL